MLDEAFLRRALAASNPNVLRMAVFQATHDPQLADMKIVKVPVRGGAFFASSVSPEDAEIVRERALTYLLDESRSEPAPPPCDAELRRLMEMLTGDPLNDSAFRMGREELALEDFPRGVEWTTPPDLSTLQNTKVAIIGAGIAGLAIAVSLGRLGLNYTIFDRQSEIGGVWSSNRYPEVRVDTNSFFYQFSFEKRYPWSEYYASGPETRKYLNQIAGKYDIQSHARLQHEVLAARWLEQEAVWELEIKGPSGQVGVEQFNFVVSASGLFSVPKLPAIAGIESFAGAISHTAQWDPDLNPHDARVGLIGTGSTGTQILPYLAREAESVIVFQRTANWISALDGYRNRVSPEAQWLFENVPYYWNWFGYSLFVASSGLQHGEAYDPEWIAGGGQISEVNDKLRSSITDYIRSKVGHDPALFEACLPKYAPLGRRPVVDNGWYDALLQDNVELVTTGIDHVERDAIVTADGHRYPVDTIVLAAGFEVERYFWPVMYEGRGGTKLDELWSTDGPRSYLSLVMPGFPNLFTIYGPNASPRAGGYYTWAELWSRYIAQAIVTTLESGNKSIEVRREIFDDYNKRLDEAMEGLIFKEESAGGYYVNTQGRVGVKMPWLVEDYYEMVAQPNLTDYELT